MTQIMFLPTGVIVGILIALGAIQCFFGYRAFKLVLVLIGFVLGYAMAFAFIETMFNHKYAAFFVGLIAGVVCGSLITHAYLVGVFIASALFGGAVALHLYAIAGQHPEPTLLFIFAVLAGVFALFFQKFMIILATALAGAWGVVAGIAWYATAALNPTHIASFEKYFRVWDVKVYAVILCWLVLSAVGVLFQYKRVSGTRPDKTHESWSRDDEKQAPEKRGE